MEETLFRRPHLDETSSRVVVNVDTSQVRTMILMSGQMQDHPRLSMAKVVSRTSRSVQSFG